jgi:hypothetical protein
LINREKKKRGGDGGWSMMRGCDILEEMILVIVSFEHLCFAVLGVTGTKGQETERFLGARKPARLLVGREDSVVSLWASGKRMLGSAQDYSTTGELRQAKEEVFFSDILLLMF